MNLELANTILQVVYDGLRMDTGTGMNSAGHLLATQCGAAVDEYVNQAPH